MLTDEENAFLTRVGPGTPAGQLLRRYWHPVAIAQDVTAERATRFVRLLGEDLVLFRDRSGRVGLLADHCAHRGASLLYGRVEERGIACAYHGWVYDAEGNCLECPAEPAESRFYLTVRLQAYPVQKFVGLYWAYLGPLPAPTIPPYDVMVQGGGHRTIRLRGQLSCNWLQTMENAADPAHLPILHQESAARGRKIVSTTRGFTGDVASFDFLRADDGIMKRRAYQDGRVDQHPLIFPNILRSGSAVEVRVPVDDTHTWVWEVRFHPAEKGSVGEDGEDPAIAPTQPFKEPADKRYPDAMYEMDRVDPQDYMAWETQGPVANREVERLATSDRGIVLYRQMLRENIELVARGLDPMGVVRGGSSAMIDTGLAGTLALEATFPREFPVSR